MSATPTPRAVLEKWLNPKGGQVYAAERIAQFETEYHAALAASAGPLAAEEWSSDPEIRECMDNIATGEKGYCSAPLIEILKVAAPILRQRLLTAYTALAAECHRLRLVLGDWRAGAETYHGERDEARAELAALRATVADDWLDEAFAMVEEVDRGLTLNVIRSGGNDMRPWWNQEKLKRAERIVEAYNKRHRIARTPTPEGQG